MSVVYRTTWADDANGLLDRAPLAMADWLRSKGLDFELEAGEFEHGSARLRVEIVEGAGHRAARYKLSEEQPGQHWTTILTVMQGGGESYGWVDLEWVADDVYARPPDLGSPRIVRDLVASGSATSGGARLTSEVAVSSSDDVPTLVARVGSSERRLPIVVFTVATGQYLDDVERRAKAAAEALCGAALVYMLPGQAVNHFNNALGSDLAVYGGAVRTYLPGMSLDEPRAYRHRYISRDRIARHPRAAANILTRHLFPYASATRPPRMYREHVQLLFANRDPDSNIALEMAAEVEQELSNAKGQLEDLRDAAELAKLEQEGAQQETARLQARVRYLERELSAHGHPAFGVPTPPEELPLEASTCVEAAELARQHLPGVVFCDGSIDEVTYLDGFDRAGVWAQNAWRTMRAFDTYVEGKRSGDLQADFQTANRNGDLGTFGVPASWITMHESQTTENNPGFRGARTFPVPPTIDANENVYMPAHIKLQAGGSPAPRIHYYDDTSGVTGRIHIGWFGDHLPNRQTN